ncbi:uncharacterized protein [Dermacentor albipictus]|uniref:uncharacterized protein n=1 Tax=Dermacentor albipictus TaxID=60249 RepID=UPI0031FBA82E
MDNRSSSRGDSAADVSRGAATNAGSVQRPEGCDAHGPPDAVGCHSGAAPAFLPDDKEQQSIDDNLSKTLPPRCRATSCMMDNRSSSRGDSAADVSRGAATNAGSVQRPEDCDAHGPPDAVGCHSGAAPAFLPDEKKQQSFDDNLSKTLPPRCRATSCTMDNRSSSRGDSAADVSRGAATNAGSVQRSQDCDAHGPPDAVGCHSGAAPAFLPDDKEQQSLDNNLTADESTAVSPPHTLNASEGNPYSFAYLCSLTLGALLLPGSLFLLPMLEPADREDSASGGGRQLVASDSGQFARRAGPVCASRPHVFDRQLALPPAQTYSAHRLQPIIFCHFNNEESAARNFTVAHIAAPYCGRLVYSYFVPRNEGLATLVPALEKSVGLSHLAELRARNKWSRLSVIVTIGGHEEDDAHFSYLGQEPRRLARFARSVMLLTQRFGLDGVNVEWLRLEGTVCGSRNDPLALVLLLRYLRGLAKANRLLGFTIAFTLHLQSSWNEHIKGIQEDIDLIFLGPIYTRSSRICPIHPAKRVRFFNEVTSKVALPLEHVCSSFTLLLRHRNARGRPVSVGDSEEGYATQWEASQLPLIEVTAASVGCDQWRVTPGRLFGHEFASDGSAALQHYVNHTGTHDGRLCLLLQDLHSESNGYPNTGAVLRDLFSQHCRPASAKCHIDTGASG